MFQWKFTEKWIEMHLPYEPTEVIVPNAELKSNNEADFYK